MCVCDNVTMKNESVELVQRLILAQINLPGVDLDVCLLTGHQLVGLRLERRRGRGGHGGGRGGEGVTSVCDA